MSDLEHYIYGKNRDKVSSLLTLYFVNSLYRFLCIHHRRIKLERKKRACRE